MRRPSFRELLELVDSREWRTAIQTRPLTKRGRLTLAQHTRRQQGARARSALLKTCQKRSAARRGRPDFGISCAPCEPCAHTGFSRTLPAHTTPRSTGTGPSRRPRAGRRALPRETGRRPRSSRPRSAAPGPFQGALHSRRITANTHEQADSDGGTRAHGSRRRRPGAHFRPASRTGREGAARGPSATNGCPNPPRSRVLESPSH